MLLLKALSPFWQSLISLCVSLSFQGLFWQCPASPGCSQRAPQACTLHLCWPKSKPHRPHLLGTLCCPFFSSSLLKSSKMVARWKFSSDLVWISRPALVSSGSRQVRGLNMLLDTICLNKNTWLVKVNTCKKLCQL